MSGKLHDRVAIVTGSSSGNGRAIALALAAEGAIVVCSDLRREAREGGYEPDIDRATDEAIRLAGGKAEFVEADAARYADVERLVTQAAATFGRLDVMVNNAGIFTDLHTIVDETEDEYDRTMAVNAKGVWLGCKFAIRQMLTQEPVDGSRGPGGEHRLDRRLGRVGRGTGVLRRQGCGGQPDPPAGGRLRPRADQRQRRVPGVPADRDGPAIPGGPQTE
jgi:NAD(P)-dependent dehydrogenase (short-subunit alcohol dehydrogenase family)